MMKTTYALILGLLAPVMASAIGRVVLKNFNGSTDGTYPSNLIAGSDGNTYGTAYVDGAGHYGVFFKIVVTGTRSSPTATYSVLHDFHDGSVSDDGMQPYGKLVQDGSNYFYGTCQNGGAASYYGTVYRLDPSNGALRTLHSFCDGSYANDGNAPQSGLVQDGSGNLYGTTMSGAGTAAYGTIFKLAPAGGGTWSYSVAYRFAGGSSGQAPVSLTLGSDGKLYGATLYGGANGDGVLFRYDPSSNGYSNLYDISSSDSSTYTALVQVPTSFTGGPLEFWSTTPYDGANGYGTVFKLAETYTGSGVFNYTVMHDFANTYNNSAYPGGDLLFSTDISSSDSSGAFYGMTAISEDVDPGCVFRIDLSGNYLEPTIGPFYGAGDVGGGLARGVIGGVPVLFGAVPNGGANYYGAVFEAYLQ